MIQQKKDYRRIQTYLIEKWLPENAKAAEQSVDEETGAEKKRELAYQNCYQTIKKENVVSRSILRKWFGLGGESYPKREQIFHLALAVHFTVDELQEYLMEGILEPGLQLNDYREMIFLYGLEHDQSYQECLDMITLLERYVNQDTVILQRTHTAQLREYYQQHRKLSKEAFLRSLCEHAEYFKGYSRVALKHFIALKSEIIQYVQENAMRELERALDTVGYRRWAKENDVKVPDKEAVQRFVKNVSRRKDASMKEADRKAISNLMRLVYTEKEKNSDLLKEVYSSVLDEYGNRKKTKDTDAAYAAGLLMDEKDLSELLGIAEQKEREIKLAQALSCVEGIEDKKKECPEWIKAMLSHYKLKAANTVGEAEKVLEKQLRYQHQRCHLLQRRDLLPFIHYVAQMRYDSENHEYNMHEAMDWFIAFANDILADCQMALINEKYQIDSFFLASFGATQSYSMADLLEEGVWMDMLERE